MRIHPSTKIYMAPSSIHGWGVFAERIIFEGDIIEECPFFDVGMKNGEVSPCVIDYRFNWPQGGGMQWEKQVVAGGFGSFYNHSDTANAAWRSNIERNTFEFVATKLIQPDEEIFVWYGDISYWNDGRNHIEVK
jgi:SET domain-containing protein